MSPHSCNLDHAHNMQSWTSSWQKFGNPSTLAASYRPISLLYAIFKVLERLVLNKILLLIPLSTSQHWFRSLHLTSTFLMSPWHLLNLSLKALTMIRPGDPHLVSCFWHKHFKSRFAQYDCWNREAFSTGPFALWCLSCWVPAWNPDPAADFKGRIDGAALIPVDQRALQHRWEGVVIYCDHLEVGQQCSP